MPCNIITWTALLILSLWLVPGYVFISLSITGIGDLGTRSRYLRPATISNCIPQYPCLTWWRHQMEIFSALLAICAGNSPVTGEFPTQRPVTRSFDVYFDLRPNERLSKQWGGWWFERLSRSLWRHRNEIPTSGTKVVISLCIENSGTRSGFIRGCVHLRGPNPYPILGKAGLRKHALF